MLVISHSVVRVHVFGVQTCANHRARKHLQAVVRDRKLFCCAECACGCQGPHKALASKVHRMHKGPVPGVSPPSQPLPSVQHADQPTEAHRLERLPNGWHAQGMLCLPSPAPGHEIGLDRRYVPQRINCCSLLPLPPHEPLGSADSAQRDVMGEDGIQEEVTGVVPHQAFDDLFTVRQWRCPFGLASAQSALFVS